MLRTTLALLLVAMGSRIPSLGAQDPPEDLGAQISRLCAPWERVDAPGFALGVIRDGDFVYRRGFGLASLEHDVPITAETVFQIASTSKQFTAFCIALLAHRGLLNLDQDIHRWFPELPDYGSPITIRHLVHHTSGIRDYLTLAELAGYREADYFTPAESLETLFRQKGLNFLPGESYEYSNSNYFLLGEIVRRVSGTPLPEFARKNIFEPLGMGCTHYQDHLEWPVKGRAQGYAPRAGGGFDIQRSPLEHVGDGQVLTTLEDLRLWDGNFYQPVVGGPEVLATMLTVGARGDSKPMDYAFGLVVDTWKGLRRISHGGAFAGFCSEMVRFPDERLTVICLANTYEVRPTRLCLQVARICLGDRLREAPPAGPDVAGDEVEEVHGEEASEPPPALQPPGDLREYPGTYENEELPSTVRIILQEGKLVLRARHRPDLALGPAGRDGFRHRGTLVRFTRDAAGQVDGLVLDVPRARRIVFRRH